MNPRFPIYIVSKGRHQRRLTARFLESIRVPYFIVVEEQEFLKYVDVTDKAWGTVLALDPAFQLNYDIFSDLGAKGQTGSGPARNFAWSHAISQGAAWHWCMDDNIQCFYRLNRNSKKIVGDGTVFRVMEDFCLRYQNIGMAGPQYEMFAPRKKKMPPFVLNTRIYSCNLIRNDLPFRWRGRYNEDTDLSLRMLKAGWCTVLFNAFLQKKISTLKVKGGNTELLYGNGAFKKAKSQMLVDMHPDVARLAYRFHRWHHYVDYSGFKWLKLERRPEIAVRLGTNEYGMALRPT